MLTAEDMDRIERAFGGLIRTGRVSAVKAASHRVEVEFAEVDGVVSWDLPFLVTRPGDYSIAVVDTLVVCLMAPGNSGVGFVLGCIYSDADDPPTDEAGARVLAGDDVRLGSYAATIPVALADYVDDRIATIQTTFDAHIHTTTATIGPSAVVGTISPPTTTIGAQDTVAAEKVVAE